MTYSAHILSFLKSLHLPGRLPNGIMAMNPYQNKATFALCEKFYRKYYNNCHQRHILIGINPGRFGAGITGIPFTDPVKLQEECGITNDLPKKRELSADFIYRVIKAHGGNEGFFGQFYIGSVSPLGFTKGGKNLNYYDDPKLLKSLAPFVTDTIKKQIRFGVNTERAYCIGEGKNFQFLSRLNREHGFFKSIIPLPHPRFIMQYRRKKVDAYIQHYLNELNGGRSFMP